MAASVFIPINHYDMNNIAKSWVLQCMQINKQNLLTSNLKIEQHTVVIVCAMLHFTWPFLLPKISDDALTFKPAFNRTVHCEQVVTKTRLTHYS